MEDRGGAALSSAAPATPQAAPRVAAPALESRPDDTVRQARLDAMKRRATGLLAVAAAGFGAASAVEGPDAWLGYGRAPPRDFLVGGLAGRVVLNAPFRPPP